jgi:molybdopterin-containing oxidoreductase family membrane subunit
MLNELGIYSYNQISKMTAKECDIIDELLGTFQGRAKRDEWAKQAKSLL